MEKKQQPTFGATTAVEALAALAQEHRLNAFRMLVRAGPTGLSAGKIAEELDMPASSLSFHLSHLRHGGMIIDEREGRSIIYRANFAAMNGLMAFLLENCCEDAGCLPPPTPQSKTNKEHV